MAKREPYGYELILDLHDCDASVFNRTTLRGYFTAVCRAIGMKRCKLHFWDDRGVPKGQRQTSPHTKGTSAVQFILTSSIVVHALQLLKAAYVNIFSCKPFDVAAAKAITKHWFGTKRCKATLVERI